MAAKVYEVTSSVLGEAVDFGDGKMNKYVLSLKDEDGNVVEEAAQWLAPGKEPALEGDKVECEVVNQPRGGLKVKGLRKLGGNSMGSVDPNHTPAQSNGSGGYVPEDERQASIQRQVALKAAAEVGSALISAGKAIGRSDVISIAEQFDGFLRGGAAQAEPKAEVPAQEPTAAVSSDDDIPF